MDRNLQSGRSTASFRVLAFLLLSQGTFWTASSSMAAEQGSAEQADQEIRQIRDAFVEFLSPQIEKANSFILKDRRRVLSTRQLVLNRLALTRSQRGQYRGISNRYGIPFRADPSLADVDRLLQRVDEVPRAIVLERAAAVSNWGVSPRARQTGNFFGLQCRRGVCKLQPDTAPGTPLSRFSSPLEATRAYLHMINTHPEFESFRVERARSRAARGARRS
ncbi:MAG: hypothetical protein KDI31_14055 [Pseudomonadales bacterium]|nr:hypothetical protein [Pseudomonadales bacterium]